MIAPKIILIVMFVIFLIRVYFKDGQDKPDWDKKYSFKFAVFAVFFWVLMLWWGGFWTF